MTKRTAILLVILAGVVLLARFSAQVRRDARIDLLVEQAFALKPGSHMVVDFSND